VPFKKKLKDLNKIKSILGIKKRMLILLETYKQYKREFDTEQEAIDFLEEIYNDNKISGKTPSKSKRKNVKT
jgi:L-fucose isomerase-like protein